MIDPAGDRASDVETVRTLFEAFNSRDVEGGLSLLHPDIVFEPVSGAVLNEGEPYRGHEGMRRYFAHVEEHWQKLTVNPVQIRAAGRAVVALGHASGEGAGGALREAPTTWVFKLSDGLVTSVQIFSDERLARQALEADPEVEPPLDGEASWRGEGVAEGATSHALRRACREDLRTLASALAEAFYEDPVFAWLLPDEESRLSRLRRFYAIELRDVAFGRGCAWTSSELAGAAISAPPGAWRVPPRTMLAQGRLFGAGLIRAARLLFAVERRHLREPHHYFAHIGVTPPQRGKGLGSSLMRPTLEQCDSEGLPAYLEASSERSAALYERLGFELVSEISVAGSPPMRLMRRGPQPAA
jgi:ketosteroid isomerase-like protein/GNAT superfamily N-acetyltransferase